MHNDNIHGGPGLQITYDQKWPFIISLRKWQAEYSTLLSQDSKVEAWAESAS